MSLFHIWFFNLVLHINTRGDHTFDKLLLSRHISLKHKVSIDIVLIIILHSLRLILIRFTFDFFTWFQSAIQIRILSSYHVIVLRVIVHGTIFDKAVTFSWFIMLHISLGSLICYIVILISFKNRLHHWLFFRTFKCIFESTPFKRIEAPIRIILTPFGLCSRFLLFFVRLHRCVAFISKTLQM